MSEKRDGLLIQTQVLLDSSKNMKPDLEILKIHNLLIK